MNRRTNSGGGNRRVLPDADAYDLIVEVLALFFRLQALGKRSGAVNPWGGGVWGFLRTLATSGPATVPEIARARPVSRQHIQKLADELAAQGLVEFADNPRHKRSKLVRLTAKGRARFEALDRTVRSAARTAARTLDPGEVAVATAVLRDLLRAMAEAAPDVDK